MMDSTLTMYYVCFFKAIIIQSWARAWLMRKKYLRTVQSVIKCQCFVRQHLAKKRFKELKREARSMEHMKKLNKGLENKIISMQQKIGEMVCMSKFLQFSDSVFFYHELIYFLMLVLAKRARSTESHFTRTKRNET